VLRTASAPTLHLVHPRQAPRETRQQTSRQTSRQTRQHVTRTMPSSMTTPHSGATPSPGTAPLGPTPPSYRSITPLSTPTNPASTYREGRGRTLSLTVMGSSLTSQTGCSRPRTHRPTRRPRPCFRTITRTRWCSQWLPRRRKEAGKTTQRIASIPLIKRRSSNSLSTRLNMCHYKIEERQRECTLCRITPHTAMVCYRATAATRHAREEEEQRKNTLRK
jgi:hypothetical protein